MSKKIKIEIKNIERKEFTLKEDAHVGDFISLDDVNNISFEDLTNELKANKQKIINDIIASERDYIVKNSETYLEQLDKNQQLLKVNNQLQIVQKNQEENFNLRLSQKISETIQDEKTKANLEIAKMQQMLDNQKENTKKLEIDLAKIESDTKAKSISEIEQLKQKIIKLELNEKGLKNEFDLEKINALDSQKQTYEEKLQQKDGLINELTNRRNFLTIKDLGEELENWINTEASNNLALPNTNWSKTSKDIDGTKPDFKFEVLNDDGSILTSVTIEAKSESLNAKSRTKNRDHIAKLDSDRIKQGSEYALLITSLEKDNEFMFKRVGEYKNMYMVRPSYFVSFLLLIYNIAQKQKELQAFDIDFKRKQEILNDFEQLKNDILETTLIKIEKNIEEIFKQTSKMKDAIQKTEEQAFKIEKHLTTVTNKIDHFKINKVIKNL